MKTPLSLSRKKNKVKVVLFSGGRGSRVLSKQLINNPRIALTLAINGYDDGASTGEIRRFLGDSLGPSDFRKNALRLARELRSCSPGLIDLLELRFPPAFSTNEAIACLQLIGGQSIGAESDFQTTLKTLLADVGQRELQVLRKRILRFQDELARTGRPFSFADCSLGNIVNAGCFLEAGRDFNAAIADFCALFNLPAGVIQNVTDGTDAYLVALDRDYQLLGSEAQIVDANKRNHIKDIYLLDRCPTEAERNRLRSAPLVDVMTFLNDRSKVVVPNPQLIKRIAGADLIIYAPGTQHSSLFPSYLTPGIGLAIAKNLTAIKILITNIQEDAEIPDSSALDIIDRAVFYLKEKGLQRISTPRLITHYLVNDPSKSDGDVPYVPLGRLETLEDPRLVRIGNYERGITGFHDATKVLTPFIDSILKEDDIRKIAVLLLSTGSPDKVCQTILEMLRGDIQTLPISVVVFYSSKEILEPGFTELLPFEIHNVYASRQAEGVSDLGFLDKQNFDYVILFESSGMYRGHEIVNLISFLDQGRLDAVWGSRRLSVTDIRESYKLRYRKNVILGGISYLGSHLLSMAYLLLYGRYISDTLSGVRAVRISYLSMDEIDLEDNSVNQQILSVLLRKRADILETPIQFFPLAPEKVRRTTVFDGLQSLLTVLWWRFKPLKGAQTGSRPGRALHLGRSGLAPAEQENPISSEPTPSSR